MSGIIRAFDSAFTRKEEQGWEKMYVLVDIHDTIFKACYENEETYEAYPWALTTLRLMTQHKDICLILWTSTYPEKLDEYLKKFAECRISFDMINGNSEVPNTELSCFDHKPYFNVGIDDRFGFNPEEDWRSLWFYLVGIKEEEK